MRFIFLALLLLLLAVSVFAQPFSSGLALQRTVINVSTATTTTLIAAVTGQTINVYGMELFCNGANSITVADSTPTTLVPIQALVASQGYIRDLRSSPWFTAAISKALTLVTSAAQQCSGNIYYTQG
jgi:hypothetical protein